MKDNYITRTEFKQILNQTVREVVGEAVQEILQALDQRFIPLENDVAEIKEDMKIVKADIKKINHKLDVHTEQLNRHDGLISYNLQVNKLSQLPA